MKRKLTSLALLVLLMVGMSQLSASGSESAPVSIKPTTSKLYVDGEIVDVNAYNINDNNYFKLRDIGKALDFCVIWDSDCDSIFIDTRLGYEDSSDIFHNIRTGQLDALTQEESVKIKQMSSEIIDCIKEQDREMFKNLFCEQVRNSPDFEKEIDEFFEFCNCYSLNKSIINETASGGGMLIQGGERVEWQITPEITYLKIVTVDDADEWNYSYYRINYYWQIIDEADKTREGLHYLNIELLNVDKLEIGKKV